jgi:hypothetical protein
MLSYFEFKQEAHHSRVKFYKKKIHIKNPEIFHIIQDTDNLKSCLHFDKIYDPTDFLFTHISVYKM